MKKKTTSKRKPQPRMVHAYQHNPYALQVQTQPPRNAAPMVAQPELVPVIVQPAPRRRRRVAQAVERAKERVKDRIADADFLATAGLAAAGSALGAAATGWAAGRGWNPYAMAGGSILAGGALALAAPGAWRGVGIGVGGWGAGQLIAALMQAHALKEFERQQKAAEEKKRIEDERAAAAAAAAQQRALDAAAAQKALPPAAKPSNAFIPPISDAFSNARTYGHYGRADDEERMTDLDLVLG
jgi:hypothetical protein